MNAPVSISERLSATGTANALELRGVSKYFGALAALEGIERPAGFSIALAGEHEEQDEVFGGLFVGIVLALLLVFAVMGV